MVGTREATNVTDEPKAPVGVGSTDIKLASVVARFKSGHGHQNRKDKKMQIGEPTLKKGGELLTNAMLSYITKINEAFKNNEGDEVVIGMKLTIKPGNAEGSFNLNKG